MRQVRLGSYSIAATLAGTPSLVRLKSMMRYCRLWPPPGGGRSCGRSCCDRRCRGFGASSDFSGVVLVISEKSETVWNRRPGLVGLRLRMAMGLRSALEQLDAIVARRG